MTNITLDRSSKAKALKGGPSAKDSSATHQNNNTTTATNQNTNQNNTNGASLSTSIANTRAILGSFEKFQKERLHFVQTIADHASREHNIDILQQAGVMQLLKPLLSDPVPAIQQAAAVALGRLANYNQDLATAVVNGDILPQLVFSLSEQNRFYKKSAAFVLRSISKHSPQLAQSVVESGALQALVQCLEEFDPGVKEASAWALGYIARHNSELAQAVVDAGAVPLLVLCVQEPEMSLKRIAASSLSDIAKHTPELAQSVVDAQTISILAPFISARSKSSKLNGASGVDTKLQRQVLSCLSQIAKHTLDLAEAVVDGEIFPGVLHCLKDPADGYVRRNAASLICEISKHTPELAQLIVNSGGVAAMVDYLSTGSAGGSRLPGIMTLGYISAFSETLALAVVVSKGVPALAQCLSEQSSGANYSTLAALSPLGQQGGYEAASLNQDVTDEYVKAAACWSLGQIGRHSPDHAKHLTDQSVLLKLLKVLNGANAARQEESAHQNNRDGEAGSDLHVKAKRALKSILANTLSTNALEPLLQVSTPPNILKYVIAQFSKILPHDVAARRAFVTSGGLARVQEIAALYAVGPVSSLTSGSDASKKQQQGSQQQQQGEAQFLGSKLSEYIRAINECYPEEIVRYYSPGYSNTLLSKIDDFQGGPQLTRQQQQQQYQEQASVVQQQQSGQQQQDSAAASAEQQQAGPADQQQAQSSA